MSVLIHCGLATPYGDRDLGLHWLMQWLVAWRHQAITWTNVDWSSVKSSDIHIRVISQEMPQPSITKIRLKILSNFQGTNELKVRLTLTSAPATPNISSAADIIPMIEPKSYFRLWSDIKWIWEDIWKVHIRFISLHKHKYGYLMIMYSFWSMLNQSGEGPAYVLHAV